MRITAIFNCKGGVGKTTTTVNLAAELVAAGGRVCVIDADPQANSTDFLLHPLTEPETTIYDLMTGAADPESVNAAVKTRLEGVTLIPGDERLYLADLRLFSGKELRSGAIGEICESMRLYDDYSHILIDCPPGFTAATVSALAAADDIVIPLKLDAFSLRGEELLARQVNDIRGFNPRLRIAGVLVTMDDKRTTVSRDGVAMLRESAIPVYHTTIRRSTVVDQATFVKTPLRDMPQASKVAEDYKDFCAEYTGGAL